MRYLTDRKRAIGMGSGRHGTHHHWQMMMSSLALLVVVPLFIVTFAYGFGGDYAATVAYFSQPVPALITAATLIVVVLHTMNETIVALEDYVPGVPGKLSIVAVTWASYTVIAVGLYALARMSL